jgi:hypothetical protein
MKQLTTSILGLSLLQAVGAAIILWLWSVLMINGEKLLNLGPNPTIASFVAVPIIFMITVVLAGGAVLGYPIYLALQNQWWKAIGLTLLTLVWLGILGTILILIY